MAFQIKPDEPLTRGVRRIVKDQVDKALDGLTGQSDEGPEEVVHGARKRFKKVRAVLRLARPGLGRKLYERENARFRDAGRPLSEVRDAGVLVEAFDALIARAGDPGPSGAAEAVRSALVGRKLAFSRQVLHDDALAEASAAVLDARRGVKRWKIDGEDRSILEEGLGRIYRKGRRAFRAASGDPTDENLHEWRKRVKDLWYALDILRPICPDSFPGRGEQAHQLADLLGDDHDLAVLRHLLTDPVAGIGGGVDLGSISSAIDRRRAELRESAFSLGGEAYREKPKAFVACLRG